MAPATVIEFSIAGLLKVESINWPAEWLAIYPWEDGELGEKIVTVIPPGSVEWTEEAVKEWVTQHFIPSLTDPPRPGSPEDDYLTVRAVVAEKLNPPDEDGAECQIVADAVELAAEFIEDQACHCTPEMIEDHDACKRCRVLGRLGDEPLAR